MKELPKYFVIKRDAKNPLWGKYIDWLNKTYNRSWDGGYLNYYGVDGNTGSNGTEGDDYICSFKNNPTLITLQEWDECVNGFILPEKWCVKINDDNREILDSWRKAQPDYLENKNIPLHNYLVSDKNWDKTYCSYAKNLPEDGKYKEITFEQFKKYVLKEKEFTLPEKWYCPYSNREEFEIMRQHFNKNWVFIEPNGTSGCCNNNDYNNWAYEDNVYGEKITFEQFKKYVLNKETMEKKIIGYKLIKPEYETAAVKITGFMGSSPGRFSNFMLTAGKQGFANDLEKAGVLDLWFEPIYEEKYVPKKGDYITFTGGEDKGKTVKVTDVSEDIAHMYWIEHFPPIVIKGVKAKFEGNNVSFGCQTYSKEFVFQLVGLLDKSGLSIEHEKEIRQVDNYFSNFE